MPLVSDIPKTLWAALGRIEQLNGRLDPAWSLPMEARELRQLKEELREAALEVRRAIDLVDVMIHGYDDDEAIPVPDP